MSTEADSWATLREEFGEENWIRSCENTWNFAYAPEALQDRVTDIIKAERKAEQTGYEPDNSTDAE